MGKDIQELKALIVAGEADQALKLMRSLGSLEGEAGDELLRCMIWHRPAPLDLMRAAISQGAPVDMVGGGALPSREEGLEMLAIDMCQPGALRLFADAGCRLDRRDSEGRTALMRAAKKYGVECLVFLIAQGADLNAVDPDGNTALMTAVIDQMTHQARILVAAGADIELKNSEGLSAQALTRLYRSPEFGRELAALSRVASEREELSRAACSRPGPSKRSGRSL